MNSLKSPWLCTLIIACFIALTLYQSLHRYHTPSPLGARNLHDLGVHLKQNGLQLRGVSSRDDGLWLDAVYFTQTDQKAEKLQGLNIDPANVAKWNGTVIAFQDEPNSRHDNNGWCENGAQWGPFVFFGDKGILKQVINALEKQ